MPMSATLRPDFAIARTSAAVSARPIRVGRDLLREAVNGVELLDRLRVGPVVALGRERPLPDVDDEEGGVETALFHLGKVDLGVEALGVVARLGEVARIDVVVRVERDDALVDAARPLDERRVGRLRGCQGRREETQDGESEGHPTILAPFLAG